MSVPIVTTVLALALAACGASGTPQSVGAKGTAQGLTGPGIQAITSLTATGSTLTGVGFSASPTAEQPVFWQAPIR